MVSYFISMIVCTKSWLQLITWHFFQIINTSLFPFLYFPSFCLSPLTLLYMLYFTISLLCFPNSASHICIPFPAYLRFFPVSASLLWFPFPLPFSEFLSLLPFLPFPPLLSFPASLLWVPFSASFSSFPFPSLLSLPASLLWVPFSASFSSFTICNIYPLLSPPLPLVSQNIVGKTSGETFIFATWPA